MGKRFPFRRRPGPLPVTGLRFWPQPKRSRWRLLANIRPFALGAVLIGIWPAADPALIEPPGFLSSDPELVDEQFSRCGRGRSHACVVDGDTLKLGQRRIRVIGIEAPEVNASCPAEAKLAEASTAKLQALLNQGPFEMTGRFDDMRDRYGRDLRSLSRKLSGGRSQSIAADMRESGLARRYKGFKESWC